MDIPTISVTLILGTLILKSTDLVKYVKAAFFGTSQRAEEQKKGMNGLITLALTAVAGVVIVFVFRETDWADEIKFGQEKLSDISPLSSIVLGLVISSLGSVIYDYKKAIDNKDDARTPRFIKQ
jgi:hypothetical protein